MVYRELVGGRIGTTPDRSCPGEDELCFVEHNGGVTDGVALELALALSRSSATASGRAEGGDNGGGEFVHRDFVRPLEESADPGNPRAPPPGVSQL